MENLKPEDIKLIHLYLHDLMDKEEREAIDARIKADPEFAGEVEIQRIAQMYQFTQIKDHLKDLKNQMLSDGDLVEQKESRPLKDLPINKPEETGAEEAQPEVRMVSLWPKRLAAAAVIIGLVSSGIWYWQKEQDKAKELADKQKKEKTENVEPITPSAEDMVNGLLAEARQPRNGIPTALKKAVEAFENESTEDAIKLLQAQKAPVISGGKDTYGASKEGASQKTDPVFESYRKFYLGVSYLSKGEPAKALIYLKQVKAPLVEDARWYSALAYLKNSAPAKAKPILTEISSNPSSQYAGEAQQLLKELK